MDANLTLLRDPVTWFRTRRLTRAARAAKRKAQDAVGGVARRFATTERRAVLYYALAPSVFGREQRAVIAGKEAYFKDRASGRQRYLVRRNTHMLEKGLSMRPRRDVFAVEYI